MKEGIGKLFRNKFFLILFIFVAISIIVGVSFVNSSIIYGHTGNNVYISINNNQVTLQEAIDTGMFAVNTTTVNSNTAGLAGMDVKQMAPSRGSYANSMCVLLFDGTVKCAGYNGYGQLGNGDYYTRTKFDVVVGVNATKIVNFDDLTYCAILNDGQVKCWGYNGYGQLGNGEVGPSRNIASFVLENQTKNNLQGVTDIVGKFGYTAYEFACAITNETTGNLYCWGYNGYGQLGIGSTISQSRAVKLPFFADKKVEKVYIGGYSAGGFVCAITDESTSNLYCWGYNAFGQVGDGTTTQRNTPVKIVIDGRKVNDMALTTDDYGTSCAIAQGGVYVYCWGYNGYGQLADGTTGNRNSPHQVEITGVTKLETAGAGSPDTICALKDDGTLYCWGYNGYGQVGDGTTIYRTTPTMVRVSNTVSLPSVKDIEGYGYGWPGHFCAIAGDAREVYCWGYNGYGQLGLGSSASSYYTRPQQAPGNSLKNVQSLALGGNGNGGMSAALLSDNSIMVTGYNGYSQLGTGDALSKYVFTAPN